MVKMDSTHAQSTADAQAGPFQGVVRAKGTLWIASAHAYPVDFHVAGRLVQMTRSKMPWMACKECKKIGPLRNYVANNSKTLVLITTNQKLHVS